MFVGRGESTPKDGQNLVSILRRTVEKPWFATADPGRQL